MEVHHHTHTSRRKWTHYFWEFIMLFLAVFCGFLAEYTLEHKIEKDRERQFIKSLVNDLEADTVHLRTIIEKRNQKIMRLDSTLLLLNLPNPEQFGNAIYFNSVHTARIVDIRFTPNTGTLQQLKNAGGLRLIRNRAVADSIMRYDVSIRNLETLGEQELLAANEYRLTASKIFDSKIFDLMLDENNVSTRPIGNPPFLSHSDNELEQMKYSIHTIKVITKGMRRDSRNLLQKANDLLKFIKTAYHL